MHWPLFEVLTVGDITSSAGVDFLAPITSVTIKGTLQGTLQYFCNYNACLLLFPFLSVDWCYAIAFDCA